MKKYEKISEYQCVYKNNLGIQGKIHKRKFSAILFNKTKSFETARQAAIHVDTLLIQHRKEPVNILKKKLVS